MYRRKARHKRRRSLIPETIDQQKQVEAFYARRFKWVNALENTPSSYWIYAVAGALARFNLEPDEWANPVGELPPIAKSSPLVHLNAVESTAIQQPDGSYKIFESLEWKADVLKAATLVWAEVINLDEEAIKQVAPLAGASMVRDLLDVSDMDSFWNRRGVGLTKTDIATKHEAGADIVDTEQLRDWLRKHR